MNEVKLDVDSKRAIKLLTIAVNDLIKALETNTKALRRNTEVGATMLEGDA